MSICFPQRGPFWLLVTVCSASVLLSPPVVSATDVEPEEPKVVSINLRRQNSSRLQNLLPMSELTIAIIEGFGPVDGLDEWLKCQPDLEELRLICVCLGDAEIQQILALPRLSHLDVRGCRLSALHLNQLMRIASLKHLDVRGVTTTGHSFIELQQRPQQLTILTGEP